MGTINRKLKGNLEIGKLGQTNCLGEHYFGVYTKNKKNS